MWTKTRLTSLLGLDAPIVLGAFGGGYSTAALTAAVSNAGGLGTFGAVALSPEQIKTTVAEITARTDKPFGVNLWVPIRGQDDAVVGDAAYARSARHLAPYWQEVGLTAPPRPERFAQAFEAQAAALIEARPPVFTFIMGVPDAAILRDAKARGIATIGTATTVDEAAALAGAGVDAVIASGYESGGHRGSFLRGYDESAIGTLSLVPQVARAVPVPVIAAGGVADGRGIAAALALGADGVQIGTAFLASPESAAPASHKAMLGSARARYTVLTRVFTGRFSRGIPNALMRALTEHLDDVLPYPAQSALLGPLRRAAAAADRADLVALWAGQSAELARALPAAELVRALLDETDAVLRDARLRPRSGS
jgi:nitronate monooxygenase